MSNLLAKTIVFIYPHAETFHHQCLFLLLLFFLYPATWISILFLQHQACCCLPACLATLSHSSLSPEALPNHPNPPSPIPPKLTIHPATVSYKLLSSQHSTHHSLIFSCLSVYDLSSPYYSPSPPIPALPEVRTVSHLSSVGTSLILLQSFLICLNPQLQEQCLI